MLPRIRQRIGVLIAAVLAVALLVPPSAIAADRLVVQSVDTSKYPTVALTVAVPPKLLAGGQPSFTLSENDVLREGLSAKPVVHERTPIDVILLVDTSGSMKGQPLQEAKLAASRFIGAMGAQDRIAIMRFSTDAAVLADFTNDRMRLDSAIGSLQADGETALYDGVLRAAQLIGASKATDRYVVVLSDGGDTASIGSLTAAIAAVRKTRAPVYAVALSSPEYDPRPLSEIAKQSAGKQLSAKDPAALTSLYEGIAQEIQSKYVLTFESAKPNTTDLDLYVVATNGSERASGRSVVDNPRFVNTPLPPAVFNVARASLGESALGVLAVLLAFVSVGLGIGAVLMIFKRERNTLEQLKFYDQLHNSAPSVDANGDSSRSKVVDAVEYFAGKRGLTHMVHAKLEQAGLPLRSAEYIYFHLLGVIGAGLIAQILSRRLLVSTLVVLMAAFLPIALLDMAVGRRRKAFEEQLPDILGLIAGSLRAGWGIQQSIDLVVQETTEPAASEFKRVQAEVRLGLALEQSLERMAERLNSEDFRWTVSAIGVQRDVGGNLAEVLDIVAKTIRERGELRRTVKALTAEGRMSAVILSVLPFVVMFLLFFVGRGYVAVLFTNVLGLIMLGTGLAMLVIGTVWLQRITKVEV